MKKKLRAIFFSLLSVSMIILSGWSCGQSSDNLMSEQDNAEAEETMPVEAEASETLDLNFDEETDASNYVEEGDGDPNIEDTAPSDEYDLTTSHNVEVLGEDETTDEKVIAITKVKVREEPNTTSSELGLLTSGTEIVRQEVRDDGWSSVIYDDQEAFVKSEYLVTESEYNALLESTITTEEEQAITMETAENVQVVTTESEQPQTKAISQTDTAGTTNDSGAGDGSSENTQMRSDRIVYVTPSGSCYHYDKECAGGNAIEKSYDEAVAHYKPCGTCVLK